MKNDVGIGNACGWLQVFIDKRPPVPPFSDCMAVLPLEAGDVPGVINQTGNHWRKIFSLYAKLVLLCQKGNEAGWQNYRDTGLLTAQSGESLMFSPPPRTPAKPGSVRIVMGSAYANALGLLSAYEDWYEIEDRLFCSRAGRIILAPYFDYRQLSNQKVARLAALVRQLKRADSSA